MLKFQKYHGNGNDFIVLNSIDNTHKLSKSRIKMLSDRNFGIGFDQVILIGPPTKDSFDFSIRFFKLTKWSFSLSSDDLTSLESKNIGLIIIL